MSRPTLSLLVLVTLVSLVVTAPAHCPLAKLCRLVCTLSPQLKSRCESCHPGICDGKGKDIGRPHRVNSLEPPRAKSRIASEGAAEKEALPTPDTSKDNSKAITSSKDDGSTGVDGEPSAQQPGVPGGSGDVDDEDAGPEETDASVGDGTTEDVAEPSDDEAAPEETKQEEDEPADTESDRADPEQTEPEEKDPEQAESEASEPSEPEDEEPGAAEDKPEESQPEEPDLQETEPEESLAQEPEPEESLAQEPEPEEVKADEIKPSESEEETEEKKAVEEPEEDQAEDAAAGEPEKSDQTPEIPEADSPEEPKATEPKKPVDASNESDSEDSEEEPAGAAAGPTSRIFSRSGSSSALACLHNGIYRPLHSTWFDMDHCNLHVCTVHGVQTTSLTGACLPPPDDMSQCRRYRPPGQCCYSYDCQDLDSDATFPQPCYDALGFEHPHNDNWVDDPLHPCVRFFCADGVVVVLSDMRPLCPVPPSHGCVAFQPDGMCCNDFNCTSVPIPLACLDAQGIRRDNGQIWYDNDVIPCRKYLCNNGTVELLKDLTDSCQEVDGVGCTAVPVSGRCCPQLTNCSCLHGDSEFLHGVQFPDDPTYPCRRLQCDNGTIVTLDERHCAPLTCSRTFRRPGQCCYECVGCVHEGIRRPEGSFWYDDPERPCLLFTCSNSVVVAVNRTLCPDEPAGPNCQPVFLPGECCPMYDCPGVTCPYRDQIYHEGDVWVNNPVYPCDWFTCRPTGVHQVNSTYCPPLIPRDCPLQRPPGECCFSCQSGNPATCFYQGETYLEGDVWTDHPIYPCDWFTCRPTGVHQVNSTYCPPLIPRDCPRQRLPGECCFSCETTGGGDSACVDLNGVAREEGELYYIDPERCMLARCTGDEQVVLVDRTRLCQPPPNPNCTVVGVVNCCPQYLCHLMPISNCTDADGRQREDGEIYATDPERCVLVQCVEGSEDLLVDRSTLCETPEVPDGCIQTGTLDCCPVFDCSGPANCVDDSGTQHLEGDMYYDDPDNCLLVECSDGEEVVLVDKADACDPAPENPACTVEETVNCCPVYNCPHCTYNGTSYPIGARWWDDPLRQCVRYRCSSQGLVEQLLSRLPCAEVRPGCVPVRDEPACCHHKYNCMFDYHHNLIPMSDLPF